MEVQRRSEAGLSWNYLPITLHRDSLDEDFRTHILPLVRTAWSPDKVEKVVFFDGITNVLVGYYESGKKEQDMVLLRLNGEGTDVFIDRRAEIVVIKVLHEAGLAAPVYLEACNGLCYGFIPGRQFKVEEMQDDVMMSCTARTVARLHAVPVPDTLQRRKPLVWAKIDRWMELPLGEFTDASKTKRFKETIGSMEVLQKEIETLKSVLKESPSPLVLCHNDLLCGNLIYNSRNESVSIIDFEYGGANYLAYDIGNHFCEFAGIEPVDYSLYPSEAVQKKWIRYYLEEAARLKGRDPAEVSAEDIHQLYRAANKFALAAHVFWTMWSLMQAVNSTIDFDFAEYASIRFMEYQRRKDSFLSL